MESIERCIFNLPGAKQFRLAPERLRNIIPVRNEYPNEEELSCPEP